MAKYAQKTVKYLIFLYLLLFPLGKLFKIGGVDVVDLIVAIIAPFSVYFFYKKYKKLELKKSAISLFVWLVFSFVIATLTFGIQFSYLSMFYLVRLVCYLLLPFSIWAVFGKQKERIVQAMVLGVAVIAITGWLQYLLFPDLRTLKALGWDDHLFRLTSTFFDPAFTGIILLLGMILGFYVIKNKALRISYLILVTSAFFFTYSRASYLSLVVAAGFVLLRRSKRVFMLGIMAMFLVVLLLPRPASSGAQLERVHSIVLKFQNYEQGLQLINESPLVGYGFNNLCVIKEDNPASHSCSGLDNSLLFAVATSGVVGLLFFGELVRRILLSTARNTYGRVFILSCVAVFTHGMFTNTWFYNFVLGWMGLLVGISRKDHSE